MFCGNCGTQLPDGATFCSNCGKSVTTVTATGTGVKISKSLNFGKSAQFSGSFDLKNPKFLGIAAVVLVALVAIFMLFGGQSYKTAVNNFVEGVFDGDAKQVINALPDDVIDMMCEEEGMTKREMISEMDEMLDEVMDELDYYVGDNWSVKHKITGTDKYDRDDLEDIKDLYDEIGVRVKDAKIVTVKMTITAYGMSQSVDMEIGVIKVGNSWYVDVQNVDMPFGF